MYKRQLVGLRRRGYSNDEITAIHNAYRLIYSTGTKDENIQKIKDTMDITDEIQYIIDFVINSERGIIRQ